MVKNGDMKFNIQGRTTKYVLFPIQRLLFFIEDYFYVKPINQLSLVYVQNYNLKKLTDIKDIFKVYLGKIGKPEGPVGHDTLL